MKFQPPDNLPVASPAGAWLLHSGIKSLLRCDDAEVVQGIARYVVKQYRSLRIGAEFVENRRETFIPPLAAYLGAVTRFLEVRESGEKNGAIWIARLANERRAIEKLIPLLPEIDWTEQNCSARRRSPPSARCRAAFSRCGGEFFGSCGVCCARGIVFSKSCASSK